MAGGTGKHQHKILDAETRQAGDLGRVALDQVKGSAEVLLPLRGMFGALEVELGKRGLATIAVHTGHLLKALAMTADSVRLEDILPIFGIAVHRKSSTFAHGATHSELARSQLVAIRAVHVEVRFGASRRTLGSQIWKTKDIISGYSSPSSTPTARG